MRRCLPALVLAVLLAASSAQAGGRAELFRHRYVSTAVLKDGDRLPLFKRTKIDVDFRRGDEHDAIVWEGDCNYFGGDVDITSERLVIGEGVQTLVGCSKARHRRDRWMGRFFGSNPRWRTRPGERLKLTAGDRVIRLISQRRDK